MHFHASYPCSRTRNYVGVRARHCGLTLAKAISTECQACFYSPNQTNAFQFHRQLTAMHRRNPFHRNTIDTMPAANSPRARLWRPLAAAENWLGRWNNAVSVSEPVQISRLGVCMAQYREKKKHVRRSMYSYVCLRAVSLSRSFA